MSGFTPNYGSGTDSTGAAAWVSATVYAVGALVGSAGATWRCKVETTVGDVTAPESDSTNWEPTSGIIREKLTVTAASTAEFATSLVGKKKIQVIALNIPAAANAVFIQFYDGTSWITTNYKYSQHGSGAAVITGAVGAFFSGASTDRWATQLTFMISAASVDWTGTVGNGIGNNFVTSGSIATPSGVTKMRFYSAGVFSGSVNLNVLD